MIKDLLIFLCSILSYALIILLPIYMYLRKKKNLDVLKYLKLKNNCQRGIRTGIIISILYIIFLIIKCCIHGQSNVDLNIGIRWLYGLTVGFVEEIPIRGFVLNKFSEKFKFLTANIFTTLIFITLHFPTWIMSGTDIVESAVRIAVISLAFGYLVKEFDSLWPTVICHSVFNLSIWTGLA